MRTAKGREAMEECASVIDERLSAVHQVFSRLNEKDAERLPATVWPIERFA